MTAQIKYLREGAKLIHGSEKSAGYDVVACTDNDIIIAPGTCEKIGTGIAMTPPEGYSVWVLPRSGMATKRGLRPANTPGLCDEDYTGEYLVALYNDSDEHQVIHPGDRIAQLVFVPTIIIDNFEEVEELHPTNRGNGGFGSTGNN